MESDDLKLAESVTSKLAGSVHDKFMTAKSMRVQQEILWKEALQNFNGEYGTDVTFRDGASSIFVNITQMKTMAAYSRIMAIMMPPQGFPWSIKPTPHPDMVKKGLTHAGAMASPEMSPQQKEVLSIARSACDGMRNQIKDTLIETFWEEKFSRGVLDLVTFGTMIFKGPMKTGTPPKKWALKTDQSAVDKIKGWFGVSPPQKYQLVNDPDGENRGALEWVSTFEFYPDPAAYSKNDLMWGIHRHVMNKAQVVELAEGDFNEKEINDALSANPDGNWSAEPWESGVDIINRRSASMATGKRYIVLEFWGYLSGSELRTAGHDVAESNLNKMHLSNVWVLGNNCIKINVSNRATGNLPFFVVPYEKVPYKIWGRGVPEKMADPQAIINATSRAMVENMGICITGDTVVYRHQRPSAKKQRKHGTRSKTEVTIDELWAMKNKPRGGLRQNILRTLNEETGEFFGNRVVDIYYNGERNVYRVTTKNGYTIKSTDNHPFLGEDGHWRELRDFFVGDKLTVNGTETAPSVECIDCGKTLVKLGAQRCKSCAAKVSRWNTKQAVDALGNRGASEQTARQRKLVRAEMKSACEHCGVDGKLHIHHKDKDPLNCDPTNLETLCVPCHEKWHAYYDSHGDALLHVYRDFDEIASIDLVGVEKVYDLHMTAPHHNFVANGFVVHNCAGPQVIIDVNRLVDGTDYSKIIPWGIWPIKNMEGASQEPIQFKTIPSMLSELKVLQDIFRNFVQEVTSMPDMTSGIGGEHQHNRTMGGMSMLFGAADSYTRGVVFNIDNDLTKPMVRALYDWEMQYNPDASIKGDMQVDAGGVQGLMSKELTSQRMAELIAAVGQIPGGADYINMGEVMKEIFRSMEVMSDTVVYTEDEVKKSRAEKQKAELQQQTQMAGQIAQAQNIPKAKAETTKNDMLMQVLEKTVPTDPIYPLIYAKWLEGINELDPQAEAALNMMKTRSVTDNKAFADNQELSIMQADIEMADKLRQAQEGGSPTNDPSATPPASGPSTENAPPPNPDAQPAPVQNVHINLPEQSTQG